MATVPEGEALFRSTSGNNRIWIGEPPFNPDENIPGARLSLRFKGATGPNCGKDGADPRGFDIEMLPMYDTRLDERLNDKPVLKAWVIEQLMKPESGYGKYYSTYDPDDDPVEITAGEKRELEEFRKTKGNGGNSEEVNELKQQIKAFKAREGKMKKYINKLKGDQEESDES